MAVIAIGSLSPGVGVRAGPDALLHGWAYLVLAWLLRRSLATGWPGGMAAAAVAVVAWGYGLIIEGLQGLLPHRTAEVRDLYANALGVGIGLVLPLRLGARPRRI